MKKVRPGEPFKVSAADWNQIADAVRFVAEQQNKAQGGIIPAGMHEGLIRVHNATKAALPIYTVVALEGRTPSVPDYDYSTTSVPTEPYFKCSSNITEVSPYAVLQEPLGIDEVGKARVFGVTPVRFSDPPGSGPFAAPCIGSDAGRMAAGETGSARILCAPGSNHWGIVMLGGGGGGGGGTSDIRLCEIRNKESTGLGTYDVSVYSVNDDGTPIGRSTLCITEIALGSTLPERTRVLGHLSTLRITGGNE